MSPSNLSFFFFLLAQLPLSSILCSLSFLNGVEMSIRSEELTIRYNHQNTLVSLFYRYFQDQSSWALPILYTLLKDLRDLAEQVSLRPFLQYTATASNTLQKRG